MKKSLKLIIEVVFLILCVVSAYYLSNWMFTTVPIDGPSMESTISDTDKVILYKVGNYRRGDIVIFNTHLQSSTGERHFVKRIIALGGDTVEIKAGEDGAYYIYVNDVAVQESYLSEGIPHARAQDAMEKFTVKEGEFFFCGDNRLNSSDSRSSSRIMGKVDDIVGRVVVKYNNVDGLKDVEFIKRVKKQDL